jgi:nucleotide-binding universal stress UspA family protein
MARPSAGRNVGAMFRTIVIGYDGPERGGDAVALAEILRDPRRGTLVLTAAYSPVSLSVRGYVLPDEIEAIRDSAEASLTEARAALRDPSRARIHAVPCDFAPLALTAVAEEESADLIVVGSTHRGAFGRVLPGTTAERLLHGAPCAVAVAPRAYHGGDIRRIGVAYDASPEAEAALHAAESLALELRAALTVYCVVEPTSPSAGMIAAGTGAEWPSRAAKERARHLLYAVTDNAPDGLKLETLLLHGVPAEEIARRAYGVIDILFVGSHGYGPLRRSLLGSVSGALVRNADCPVVVTPRSAVTPRTGPKAVAASRGMSAR